jgi:hypothetical protein
MIVHIYLNAPTSYPSASALVLCCQGTILQKRNMYHRLHQRDRQMGYDQTFSRDMAG